MGQIYGIIYKPTEKIVYVGQTKNSYSKRWSMHKQQSKDLTRNYAFCNALRKYGVDNFYPILIEECLDQELNNKEQYWINYYHTYIEEQGYNLTKGGDTPSNLMCKPVYQYDLQGNYLSEFASISEAQRVFSNGNTGIFKAVYKQIKQAYGYQWSLEKLEKLEKYIPKEKAIYQLDKQGNIINKFSSLAEAAQFLNKPKSNISAAALGKRKTAYGYQWKYEND